MSTWGLKMALCLPLRRMAIWVARRPRTLSAASTTYQSARTVSDFAKTVDITDSKHRKNPHTGSRIRTAIWLVGPWKKGAECTQRPVPLQNSRCLNDLGPYNPAQWLGGPNWTP